MTRRTPGSAARTLGLGLIAVAMSATTALAGPKAALCPFSAKDIDGWYKSLEFDLGADDVRPTSCVYDGAANMPNTWTYATLSETEYGNAAVVDENGQVIGGQKQAHVQIIVNVESTGNASYPGMPGWGYEVALIKGGVTTFSLAGHLNTDDEANACFEALSTSQAWSRWSCGK